MEAAFWIGFLAGMVSLYLVTYPIFADASRKTKGKKEKEDIPVPVIHYTRLYPTKIVAEKIVHREEVAIYVDSYWKERAFADVKDKLAVDVIKHAKFTWCNDPMNYNYILRGEIMVFSDKPHLALNSDLI